MKLTEIGKKEDFFTQRELNTFFRFNAALNTQNQGLKEPEISIEEDMEIARKLQLEEPKPENIEVALIPAGEVVRGTGIEDPFPVLVPVSRSR